MSNAGFKRRVISRAATRKPAPRAVRSEEMEARGGARRPVRSKNSVKTASCQRAARDITRRMKMVAPTRVDRLHNMHLENINKSVSTVYLGL